MDMANHFSFTGVIFFYAYLQFIYLWLAHAFLVFTGIKFPMKYKELHSTNKLKYIHITITLLVTVLPCASIATHFAYGGYIVGSFPPTFCVIRGEDISFYSFLLEIILVDGTVFTLLAAMLWILIHQMKKREPVNAEVSKCSQLLLVCYSF